MENPEKVFLENTKYQGEGGCRIHLNTHNMHMTLLICLFNHPLYGLRRLTFDIQFNRILFVFPKTAQKTNCLRYSGLGAFYCASTVVRSKMVRSS